MSAPRRVQRTRKAGGGMPAGAVYVGRPSKWGNPYDVRRWGMEMALTLYWDLLSGGWNPGRVIHLAPATVDDAYMIRNAWLRRIGGHPVDVARSELAGRDLACWCALGEPCHADALIKVANDEALS